MRDPHFSGFASAMAIFTPPGFSSYRENGDFLVDLERVL